MELSALEMVAQRYRDEGYDVIVQPRGEQIPAFLTAFAPDLIATRGKEGVVVEIKVNRVELSDDPSVTHLAETVTAQPGWKLDLVVLEPETAVEKLAHEAAEPSDEQLFRILQSAEDLADRGYAPVACVVAWGGLEAAMRRLQTDAAFAGQKAANELIRALYSNGLLSREQFDRLRDSFKIRSQVVHGLVPRNIAPEQVRYLTATARSLVGANGVTVFSP